MTEKRRNTEKRRELESTVAAIQRTHGAQALRPARDMLRQRAHTIPHIASGFPTLDAITGCAGIPLGALTLLSGPSTSGKSTLAYKMLVNAQAANASAAILDLAHSADPDYLQRCGVTLERLLIVRPQRAEDATPLLLDLVQSRRLRMLLVSGVRELSADRQLESTFNRALSRLRQLARTAGCAVVLLSESSPRWHRWLGIDTNAAVRQNAALHIDLQREQWLRAAGVLAGYAARAQVVRSLWCSGSPTAPIEIVFNGTVRARTTW